ncbi:MAG: septum formation protein Maf [Bacteroidales bacterium]|nr:septum formation protein Maf [Bacteroidales bacterium]
MLKKLQSYEILLASRSPRRITLIEELGIPFRVVETGHTDEHYPSHLRGGEIARYLADHKSDAYVVPLSGKQILLTADTIVWHREKELGKPGNSEEALVMIGDLSGGTHQVFTGVCLRSNSKRKSFYAVTDVTFSNLEQEEIEEYVSRYQPFDKAGAYGIQEWIGYIAVERIDGSYFNVMGLPVQKVYSELKSFISH